MLSATHTRSTFSPLCGAAQVLSQQQTRNKSSKTVEVYRDASKNLSFDVVSVRCSSCCCCCCSCCCYCRCLTFL
uniref:CG32711-PA long isoform n=1 Tax=Drosophila melanogaster TaxID=7227 RepID=Q8SXG2_DROME|eukprot:NP_001162700.1 leg arista wing complex, isoform B [Drosophila melanogaster]